MIRITKAHKMVSEIKMKKILVNVAFMSYNTAFF